MNLADMRAILRRDLHDEDPANYRWSDSELDRHIDHASSDFSRAIPREQKVILATTAGSRDIDISSLTGRIMLQAVEYPADRFPPHYQRFSLWADTVTLLGNDVPDGSNACIYYGKRHTLDATGSTIPGHLEDLIVTGAAGYAALEWAAFAINRVNIGGDITPQGFLNWGKEKLDHFRKALMQLGSKNRARMSRLYKPAHPPASQTTDYGP